VSPPRIRGQHRLDGRSQYETSDLRSARSKHLIAEGSFQKPRLGRGAGCGRGVGRVLKTPKLVQMLKREVGFIVSNTKQLSNQAGGILRRTIRS
jgi:hypothetical protein